MNTRKWNSPLVMPVVWFVFLALPATAKATAAASPACREERSCRQEIVGTLGAGLPVVGPFAPLSDTMLSQNGFGDRLNSYAWSMAVFKGDLYVGTGQYSTPSSPCGRRSGGQSPRQPCPRNSGRAGCPLPAVWSWTRKRHTVHR